MRRRTSLLVWRQNNEVYRRRLERVERSALGLAMRGAALEEICEAVSEWLGPHPAEQLNQMLHLWLRSGLIKGPLAP